MGSGGAPIDVMLGRLGDRGGVVETVALRVKSLALDAGSDALTVTRLGSSSVVYEALGRVVKRIATDPDRIGGEAAPVTSYGFDANGNMLSETDPLGSVTVYAYDHLGPKTSETDGESGVISYAYEVYPNGDYLVPETQAEWDAGYGHKTEDAWGED